MSVQAPGCAPLHVPVGAQVELVQQTPSTHASPDLHCALDVHDAPAPSSDTHAPALQKKPAAQSVLDEQPVRQAAPTQLKTPHDFAVENEQSPLPLHPAASYSTPPAQIEVPVQVVDEPGKWHAETSLPLHDALLQLPSPLPSVGHAARVEGGAPVTGTQ